MFMYPLLIELRRANARESRREFRRPGVLPSPPLAIEPRRPPEVDSRRSMLKVLGRRDIRRCRPPGGRGPGPAAELPAGGCDGPASASVPSASSSSPASIAARAARAGGHLRSPLLLLN